MNDLSFLFDPKFFALLGKVKAVLGNLKAEVGRRSKLGAFEKRLVGLDLLHLVMTVKNLDLMNLDRNLLYAPFDFTFCTN